MKHIEEINLKLESEKQLKNCEDMHIWVQPIKDYIKELEAKEERAKKVEELLGLYREKNLLVEALFVDGVGSSQINKYQMKGKSENYHRLEQILIEIEVLEEELK